MKKVLVILFFGILLSTIKAQAPDSVSHTNDNDSLQKAKAIRKQIYSEPRKASIMSALLPGLGQAYNKKYWKIPVVYLGLGGFGYFFLSNNAEYNMFRKNLIAEADDDPETINEMPWYNATQLQTEKLRFRKYRDYCAVGFVLMYILNIVDANVDAHLKSFDISDDLSLKIEPWQNIYRSGHKINTATGLSLTLNFK